MDWQLAGVLLAAMGALGFLAWHAWQKHRRSQRGCGSDCGCASQGPRGFAAQLARKR